MAGVSATLPEMIESLLAARGTLGAERRELLELIGVRLLSLGQQDYRVKARGGTGQDGIRWAALKRETLERRVRRRGPARAIVAQRRALANTIRAVQAQNPRPPGASATIAAARARRRELSERLEALVTTEMGRYEIGVDTGAQRASASPGFQASDGLGGNLLEVSDADVTVGYNREYSGFFDAERPLFPDTLPAAWQAEIERLVEQWAMRILTRELSNGF